MNTTIDTIVAQATPGGRGGIGIIRVSGPDASFVATSIIGQVPKPRYAHYAPFKDEDGSLIDQGMALFFPAPNSFTGEDVLELHGHGGPVVMDTLLKRILKLKVRVALPGEFSQRAFLNDKIDLVQAEAIADLIDAQSTQALKAALRSLRGEFSQRISVLVELLTQLRMYVEAAIDFPEEEIDFLSDGKIAAELKAILAQLNDIISQARQGNLLNEGMKIIITGPPNVGKSSLLNKLSGEETAIVSDIPGTTRDIVRQHIQISGMPLQFLDTAGLRSSSDLIEQEGVRRALHEISQADRVLLVTDASQATDPHRDLPCRHDKITYVRNKIDLVAEMPSMINSDGKTTISLSVKTSAGIDLLKDHLTQCMGFAADVENGFIARRRHLDALNRALSHIKLGQEQLLSYKAGELLAEELKTAQSILGEITGEFRADDLLGRIFNTFCIGK